MSEISGSRKKAFGFISAVLGVVIALVVAELALGLLKPSINPAGQMDEGFILYDSRLGWKLAPGWEGQHSHHDFKVRYGVNSLGFRGNALNFSRPGSMMFLGDSFTFGLGVNDDVVFTERLSESSDRNVLNAGVPGYANDQQLLLLDRLVEYRPEVLVWVVYLGNDLLDNGKPFPLQAAHGKPYFELQPGGGLALKNVPVPLKPKPASFRARSVQSEILGDFDPFMFWQPWIDPFEIGGVVNGWAGIDAEGLEEHLQTYSSEKIDLFMAIVNEGRTLLEGSDIRLEIVLLPGLGSTQADSIPAVYQKTMASILDSRLQGAGISVLNLAGMLEELENPAELFHPNEGHFNRAGHQWLAETLAASSIFRL